MQSPAPCNTNGQHFLVVLVCKIMCISLAILLFPEIPRTCSEGPSAEPGQACTLASGGESLAWLSETQGPAWLHLGPDWGNSCPASWLLGASPGPLCTWSVLGTEVSGEASSRGQVEHNERSRAPHCGQCRMQGTEGSFLGLYPNSRTTQLAPLHWPGLEELLTRRCMGLFWNSHS